MRTIILIFIILSLYFGIGVFVGIKWSLILFSLYMVTLATIFIIKKDFYIKFTEFVNPKNAHLYINSDEDYKRKLRISGITAFYIIAAILIFLAIILPSNTFFLPTHILMYMIITTFLVSIALWLFSLLIFKKSKKISTFWLYLIGSMLFSVLVIHLVQSFIL